MYSIDFSSMQSTQSKTKSWGIGSIAANQRYNGNVNWELYALCRLFFAIHWNIWRQQQRFHYISSHSLTDSGIQLARLSPFFANCDKIIGPLMIIWRVARQQAWTSTSAAPPDVVDSMNIYQYPIGHLWHRFPITLARPFDTPEMVIQHVQQPVASA